MGWKYVDKIRLLHDINQCRDLANMFVNYQDTHWKANFSGLATDYWLFVKDILYTLCYLVYWLLALFVACTLYCTVCYLVYWLLLLFLAHTLYCAVSYLVYWLLASFVAHTLYCTVCYLVYWLLVLFLAHTLYCTVCYLVYWLLVLFLAHTLYSSIWPFVSDPENAECTAVSRLNITCSQQPPASFCCI